MNRCHRLVGTLVLLAALGCGDGVRWGDVSGKVEIDGKPAEKGTVDFYPSDGNGPSAGAPIVAGTYQAKVPVGMATVKISSYRETGKKRKAYANDKEDREIAEIVEILPARYNDQSTLTLDVKAGKNEKDWSLSTKKSP